MPRTRAASGSSGRLVGLDVARCLALVGMIATHLLDRTDTLPDLASGRSSALFAVLAGVGIGLSSGPVHGRRRWGVSSGLVVRAVLIAAAGLALGELDSGLAVILTYYGVLFLLALPFLGWDARRLMIAAGAAVVAGPLVRFWLLPHLPDRTFDVPSFGSLEQAGQPWQLISELLVTGYYPAIPWLAYLLAGLALSRIDLRSPQVVAGVAAVGGSVAVLATLVSDLLTSKPDVLEALMRDLTFVPRAGLSDYLDQSQYGGAPPGWDWHWLLTVSPHSSTPFDLANTGGCALLVIGVCLLVVGWLSERAERWVAIAFGAGTMTLTLYSLHVLLRIDRFWPPTGGYGVFWQHVGLILAIGAFVVWRGWRGPLEWLVSLLSGIARRVVGGR